MFFAVAFQHSPIISFYFEIFLLHVWQDYFFDDNLFLKNE